MVEIIDISLLNRIRNILVTYTIFKLEIDRQLNTEYALVVEDLDNKFRELNAKIWEFLENPNVDTARNVINTFASAIQCITILQSGLDIAFAKGVISNDVYNDVKESLNALALELQEKLVYAITYPIF